MRVLAVTNMYPRPSRPTSGVFVEQQVEGLRRAGIDVDVFLFDREMQGMGIYRRAWPDLQTRIRTWQPDLVHIMYGGVMARMVARRLRTLPTVVTFHGSDLLGEPLAGARRRLTAAYGVWCSRQAARIVGRIVVVSDVLRRALPSGLDDRVAIVPCGIDLDRFTPRPSAQAKGELGWSPSRIHVLFPASAENPTKRPALATAAVADLERSGVECELHFLSGVENRDVPLWMSAADCLLLTSGHEGSPTVVKEALACNLPIVSVDVGDVRERVAGVDGCIIAPATPAELGRALKVVVERGRRIDGRPRVAPLSHLAVANALERLYQGLLGEWAIRETPTSRKRF